jgi:hypothetical protein
VHRRTGTGCPQGGRSALRQGRHPAESRSQAGEIRRDPPRRRQRDVRAGKRKHHVGRRTIIKALASADLPERKKIHREPAALNGVHGHIDAMIEADPKIATATIWQRLADEHGTTVACYNLRTCVVSRRAAQKTPGTS